MKPLTGPSSGGNPEIGQQAAESKEEIEAVLKGADMILLPPVWAEVGVGAPQLAEIAKSLGALTVGVVTRPTFEGRRRMNQAEKGISNLKEKLIPNRYPE